MMEINIEKLLESGMSPESIGKMVQMEAQKKQEKDKKADAEKMAAARAKICEALWDYYALIFPDDSNDIDKNEFIDSLSQEILEFEEVIKSPLMQQIFKQSTSRCSCKEQTSEPQKNVNYDKLGYETEIPRGKVMNAAPPVTKCVKSRVERPQDTYADADIDKILADFLRTLI